MSIEEFSRLDLSAMLAAMPIHRIAIRPEQDDGSASDKDYLDMRVQMPRIVCVDGTDLSVQASRNHYCQPRDDSGPYRKVEVGFPSTEPPETWKEFIDGDWDDPNVSRTDTVYGYVPIELVMFYIGAHGGIDVKRTFKGFKFELR